LEQAKKGLESAKKSGIPSLYGWHLELFAHKVMEVISEEVKQQESTQNPKADIKILKFKVVQGTGTGKESVKSLHEEGIYWMPSTPNFASIDAAIFANGILHCIQYTISSEHDFNLVSFESKFVEQLPPDLQCWAGVVHFHFVVPTEVTFRKVTLPASQKEAFESVRSAENNDIKFHYRVPRNGKQNDPEYEVELVAETEGDTDMPDTADAEMTDAKPDASTFELQGITSIIFTWEHLSEEFKTSPLKILASA
jgi:hypothetical protein